MSKIRKDIIERKYDPISEKLKEINTSPLDKEKVMQLIIEAAKKAIEVESMDLKPDEKVVVNIDTEHPEGVKIHARKVKKQNQNENVSKFGKETIREVIEKNK